MCTYLHVQLLRLWGVNMQVLIPLKLLKILPKPQISQNELREEIDFVLDGAKNLLLLATIFMFFTEFILIYNHVPSNTLSK